MGVTREGERRRTWWSMPEGNVEDLSSWLSSADQSNVVNHIAELRFNIVAFRNAIEHLNTRLLAITAARDSAEKKLVDKQLEIGANEIAIRDLREEVARLKKGKVRK
jgi:hypothetical protein